MDETQYEEDWAGLLSLASQPGASLDQLHVFALSHILRRPIIVYGVKYVKSFRGETLGFARFEGIQYKFLKFIVIYLNLLFKTVHQDNSLHLPLVLVFLLIMQLLICLYLPCTN